MASSSSPSKSRTLLSNLLLVSVLVLLLANTCSAARLGMATKTPASASRFATSLDRPRRLEGVTSFRHRGRVFNYFPKGSTVPPSGPSKRHNDVVDSEPQG